MLTLSLLGKVLTALVTLYIVVGIVYAAALSVS